MLKTYSSKKVIISLGAHMVTGLGEDSFVTIASAGDGVTMKVGCDGEICRSVSPNNCYTIKMDLLQYSPTNSWLQNQHNKDQADGSGTFPIIVKDLTGGLLFASEEAWTTKPAERAYGKEAGTRSWELVAADGQLTE